MALSEALLTAMSYIVAAIVGLLTVAVIFLKWRFGYWRRAGIPHVKPSLPFGNANEAFMGRRHIAYIFRDIHNELEGQPFGGVYMAFQPAILLRDPKLIRKVMVKDFATHFQHRIANAHETLDPILFKNLFIVRGNRWRTLRNQLSPTFTSGKMKMMYHLVQEKADVLVEQMERKLSGSGDGDRMDMKEFLALYTTDVISSCAFGIDTNSLKDPKNEFRAMGKKIFLLSFRHLLNSLIIFMFPAFVKVTRAVFITPEVSEFFRKVVWDVVSEREKKGIVRGDFIDLLIQLKNTGHVEEDASDVSNGPRNGVNNGNAVKPQQTSNGVKSTALKKFDGDEFVAQVVLFFGAGFETSSTTGSFALFELAANPETQERLAYEIDDTLDRYDGKFTYEGVQGMKYLDMVISETLRKYPPLSILDRECMKDYHDPEFNLFVPKGMPVMVSLFGLHRDPRYFEDPEKFDPERFSDENVKKIPNYVYMPFGEGPRNCVGLRFGVMQTKVALVNLLRYFRVELPEDWKGVQTPPLDPRIFVLGVKDGIPLMVHRRNHPN